MACNALAVIICASRANCKRNGLSARILGGSSSKHHYLSDACLTGGLFSTTRCCAKAIQLDMADLGTLEGCGRHSGGDASPPEELQPPWG